MHAHLHTHTSVNSGHTWFRKPMVMFPGSPKPQATTGPEAEAVWVCGQDCGQVSVRVFAGPPIQAAGQGPLLQVLPSAAYGSTGQLQGELHFVLFPLSWDTVLLRPSWLSSWVCGSTTRSGLFLVFCIMGHSRPASVLLGSWVYGSATKWGLFCFLVLFPCFVSLFCFLVLLPCFVSFVLMRSSWLSS